MFSSYVKCPDLAYLCRREDLWFLAAGNKREVVADGHRVSSEGGGKCSGLMMVMVAQQIPRTDENH